MYISFGDVQTTPGGHFTKLKNFVYTGFGDVQTTHSGHFTKLKNFVYSQFGNVLNDIWWSFYEA